jgi:hypothetical protein
VSFDFIGYLRRQHAFSQRAFGPGRTLGVLDHARKEIVEIEADPSNLGEWIDLATLALDGALRSGHEPEAIAQALDAKLEANARRKWARPTSLDQAIEHEREGQK